MAILKIIVILLAVSFIAGAFKAYLAKRNGNRRISGTKDNPDFIAEEIYKLNELKNRGIITGEEFRKQKNKLLNK